MFKKALLVTVPILVLSTAISVSATTSATTSNPRQERREDRQEKRQEVRQKIVAKRCQIGERLIGVRINRYDNNKLLVLRFGERAAKISENLIARANDASIDTSKAEDALGEFKTKIEGLDQKYANHIEALKETQQFACGESEGKFKNELAEARILLKEARDSLLETRSYYQSTLRPALVELRQKLAGSNSGATGTNNQQ